jgi:hypothetical protein
MSKNYKMLDKLLSNFNFGKVQRTMEFLDWRWARKEGLVVPDLSDLYRTSKGILEDAIKLAYQSTQDNGTNSETCVISTGGFRAKARVNRLNELMTLDLEFVLTSWDVENEDLYEDNIEEDHKAE